MRTLRVLRLCTDRVSRAEGLSGIEVGSMDCAVFISDLQIQRFWGRGTLTDLYVNCVDDDGLVVESLFVPTNSHKEVVSEGVYRVVVETTNSLLGKVLEFEPGLVRVL